MARKTDPEPDPVDPVEPEPERVWPKGAMPYVIPDTGERVTGDEYREWKRELKKQAAADSYRSLMTDPPTPTTTDTPPADEADDKE
jgi:hypothetical protein